MILSIYSPKVQAYARQHGVTDLQAYRALKSREELQRRVKAERKRPFFERITGISPDWNSY